MLQSRYRKILVARSRS